MNNSKLVLFDMDGTFLDDNKQAPAAFFEIFKKLKEKGIKTGAASGRPYKNVIQYFPDIYKDMVFVCENGGYVVYEDEVIYTANMIKDVCDKAVKKVREIDDCEILLCSENAAYYEADREDLLVYSHVYYPNLVYAEDLCDINDTVLKMAVYDFAGSSVNCAPKFQNFDDRVICATSAKNWMDIMMKDTSKGKGMEYLCRKMNITPEECMAFGDELNDYTMLEKVKYSYAMENAKPEIKEICRYHCENNNQQGVVKVLIKEFEL